jgi:hypothetical protein
MRCRVSEPTGSGLSMSVTFDCDRLARHRFQHVPDAISRHHPFGRNFRAADVFGTECSEQVSFLRSHRYATIRSVRSANTIALSRSSTDTQGESAASAIDKVANAVTHTRFVGTNPNDDEVVLMRILQVGRDVVRQCRVQHQ